MHPISITISIVSFGHNHFVSELLKFNAGFIPKNITVVITDLLKQKIFEEEINSLGLPNLIYHTNQETFGYGKNNNIVFQAYAQKSDMFVVCNPDVEFDFSAFNTFVDNINWQNHLLTCRTEIPGGLKNNNIRRFFNPVIWMGSFLKILNFDYWYYGSQRHEEVSFDWCSGAFMVFDSKAFQKLNGFDEGYFMYIEDTDICYRCEKLKIGKKYYPTFAIKHFGQRQSKYVFNKHFRWIVQSVFRYYWKIYTNKM
ncbi:MAG: glycosyltransferase [Bacteroidetes bacterium]|nr:glycosyltransferase [Bacteroidota bacterium]